MRGPGFFLRTWLLGLVVLAICVALVNFLVDPYGIFGSPRLSGFNLRKPATLNHEMLSKTYQIGRTHPTTVLIGSSSIHNGVDPDLPDWPPDMRPIFNYAIPGALSTAIGYRVLLEALHTGTIRNAVLFLDFQNFFLTDVSYNNTPQDRRRFHENADGTRNTERPVQVATDMFLSLFTVGALADSAMTVFRQHDPVLAALPPDAPATEFDFRKLAGSDGEHALFIQKNDFELVRIGWAKQALQNWHGALPNIATVREIVALAKSRGVNITLVIAPHHADAVDLYWREGLWYRVEQFKEEIARVAADANVPLWDFLDYSPYNTEPVPAANDFATQTAWYWESTHFKQPLGRLLVQRMFGHSDAPFGALLTSDNVAARNAQVRAQRIAIVCEHRGTPLLTALSTPEPDRCNGG